MATRHNVAEGLRKLGLSGGDHVMVHSSLKSFGYVEGGAECIVEAILDTIGGNSTLPVPVNTFNGYVADFPEKTRKIDLVTAPSMTGAII